ncbi:hypothetical protein RFI_00170 [Reticulomyxa filosa]|uniref:Uncharacterized protein n=1 Tax=Reticulomyxa filosa TaxID=46433 RepID=X6PGU8_RETFI|nr:hypothetical protein RFI_00170 [Reticulomyxa filosa]|eukprot:ETO36892.1 hypothetical protein RFI_00170 [Reticulomyxa filosa]
MNSLSCLRQQGKTVLFDSKQIPQRYAAKVTVVNQTQTGNEQLTFIHLTGPSHWSVFVDTKHVTDWSLDSTVFRGTDEQTFLYIATGLKIEPKLDISCTNAQECEEDGLAPVQSDMLFWIKSKRDAKLKLYISSQHINGNYVWDKTNWIATLRDDIVSHFPNWIDELVWYSELFEIQLSDTFMVSVCFLICLFLSLNYYNSFLFFEFAQ